MRAFAGGMLSSAPSNTASTWLRPDHKRGLGAGVNEGSVQAAISLPVRIYRLYMRLDTAPGAGTSWTFTVRVNGVDSPLAVTVADTATDADSRTLSPIPVAALAAGDLLAIRVTPTNTPAVPAIFRWFIEYEAARAFPIFGGASANVATGATNYLTLQGYATPDATEANVQQVVPIAMTLRNLRVRPLAAIGAAGSYTVTVMKNGVATALSVAGLTGAAITVGADLLNQVSFAPGDTVSVQVAPTGTPNAVMPSVCVEAVPTNDGESCLMYGSSNAPANSARRFTQPPSDLAWNATEANVSEPAPSGYTYKALYAKIGTAVAAGTWNMLLRNATTAVDAIILALTGGVTTGSTTGLAVTTSDKDLIDFGTNPATTPTAMTGGAHMGVALAGPTTPANAGLLILS